ncbi:MAG TPA: STAS/SEC14 domain-containing protein [Gemmatimonadaceae bacterium]|nr:STAS/SEC14 domain-containing protein [Gemmatimonadaceae bacterium]
MTAPTAAGEPRARFVEHDGQRIILFDFSGITDVELGLTEVEKARQFVAANATPDGSYYTLTDVTRTRYDKKIVDAFKVFTAHNRPYVKAAAVVSDSGIHRAAISMIALVSKRRIVTFDTRAAALEWLAKQR